MDTLALTDRDGAYGAVKFARACYAAGIRPVLGVELAHRPVLPDLAVAVGEDEDPGARRRLPGAGRRRAAPGDVPGHRRQCRGRPGRLGGAVPAGLEHPPGRRARRAGPGPGDAARRRTPCARRRTPARAARPGLRAGPGRTLLVRGPPRRPRPGRAGPVARAGAAHPPAGRAGLPPAPGRRRRRRRLGAGHLPARRPDGRAGAPGRDRGGAEQRGALRRPRRRGHRRRPRRGPPAGGAGPAARRPRQRRGLPQVRQGDGRDRRGGRPALRARRVRARGAAAARPHPRGRRPVRPRPAPRPRPGRGALPGVRAVDRSRRRGRRPCGRGARGRSATATARVPRRWSGSGSTTSSR